jgi:hypothetical protein
VSEESKSLPEKCCAKCVWYSANQGAVTEKPEDRQCYRHDRITDDELTCDDFLSPKSTECNVPNHTPKGTMNFRNERPVDGPVEILIVTYAKDFPWLELARKCIARHGSGFSGITIVVPRHDRNPEHPIMGKERMWNGIRERWVFFDEEPGKGFLHHEAMMARADELVPAGTKYVMHMDADCMMKMSNSLEDYFLNDKPIYIWRTWDSLSSPDPRDPTRKVVSDCIMWKEPTAKQVGFHSDAYTMCRHPTVFPIEFYKPYREHISAHHRMPFMDYMLSGERNSHPQDRLDFTAFGQFAKKFMEDKFHWINCATEEYPADRMRAYWSHGGISPEIRAEIESFLVD